MISLVLGDLILESLTRSVNEWMHLKTTLLTCFPLDVASRFNLGFSSTIYPHGNTWICRDRHPENLSVYGKQLEHLQQCSVCDPKNGWRKSQHMPVWLRKLVLVQPNCAGYQWLVKGWAAALCTCKKECNNKYDLTVTQSFWLAPS
jgi:hypothetical protein